MDESHKLDPPRWWWSKRRRIRVANLRKAFYEVAEHHIVKCALYKDARDRYERAYGRLLFDLDDPPAVLSRRWASFSAFRIGSAEGFRCSCWQAEYTPEEWRAKQKELADRLALRMWMKRHGKHYNKW